jgi:hypothetical protein
MRLDHPHGLLDIFRKCLATRLRRLSPRRSERRFEELTLAAQTAYAEAAERTSPAEMQRARSGLPGAFHTLRRGGRHFPGSGRH